MRRRVQCLVGLTGIFLLVHSQCFAQVYSVGGRGGFSIFSYGNSSTGLQIGPSFDVELQRGLALGTELNINTQGGTPVEWASYGKYFLDAPAYNFRPYVDGGIGIWFVSGGPYFGIRGGGGMYFPIGPNLMVPADIQIGPVFTSGSSTFYVAITSGIRYTLP